MVDTNLPVLDEFDVQRVHYLDVDGIRTRCYEDGTGEPLVLLHGGQFGSSYSLDAWSMNLPGLAEHFHVYAIDKLGQGYTDDPNNDDYTFEALLGHTYGVLETLGATSGVHLVGHSRGGLLAAALVLAYPGLAKSLVVVDSSTLAPENSEFPSGKFYADMARTAPSAPPTRESVRTEPDAQSYSKAHVTDDFVTRLHEIALLPKFERSRPRLAERNQSVWMPSLNRSRETTIQTIDQTGLPVPTLVVWGYNDPSAPLVVGHDLFGHISAKTSHAEFHVLNHAGHYCFREQVHAFNRLLRAFCLG